ncbi:MAG TPA: hydroxymethylglutaryl-CoA reductase, degradative [Candidatus Altiarchaeales archaeon]|nr:hydroxymethylglutaryl-CoA reductase, degradative [Candidatus Altiarchaeales archaeon]
MEKSSRISGFYRLSVEDRLRIVSEFSNLNSDDKRILRKGTPLSNLDRMIENVIGKIEIPLGIATNFLINKRDYLIPMATEEPSVVAAASNAARMARAGGGFNASSTEPVMIGQIQLVADNLDDARKKILRNKDRIIEIANEQDEMLVKLGGGARNIETRMVDGMLIIHLLVDVRDAMGANAVNTMVEAVSPFIEEITMGRIYLRILSNLATKRMAYADVEIPADALGGSHVVDAIVKAYEFALADPYRAATHNKGIMNGITAVALATGNDTRAIESGAHAYASIDGRYRPLTEWSRSRDGNLIGKIRLPIAAGTVGGATSNPSARVALKILGVKNAIELAEVMATIGLAQNLAALRALSTEGIQKGHMRLHKRRIIKDKNAEV